MSTVALRVVLTEDKRSVKKTYLEIDGTTHLDFKLSNDLVERDENGIITLIKIPIDE